MAAPEPPLSSPGRRGPSPGRGAPPLFLHDKDPSHVICVPKPDVVLHACSLNWTQERPQPLLPTASLGPSFPPPLRSCGGGRGTPPSGSDGLSLLRAVGGAC